MIHVSSGAARYPAQPDGVPYAAAKAALNVYSKGLANAVGSSGVRVVTVMPGFVETDSTVLALREMADRSGVTVEALRADLHKRFSGALGRPGRGDEAVELIAFLASSRASYLTGSQDRTRRWDPPHVVSRSGRCPSSPAVRIAAGLRPRRVRRIAAARPGHRDPRGGGPLPRVDRVVAEQVAVVAVPDPVRDLAGEQVWRPHLLAHQVVDQVPHASLGARRGLGPLVFTSVVHHLVERSERLLVDVEKVHSSNQVVASFRGFMATPCSVGRCSLSHR